MTPRPLPVVQVAVTGELVTFTFHSVRRWRERRQRTGTFPTFSAARRDLAGEVAAHGAITTRRPRGVELHTMRQKLETVGWLVLEAGAFPLVNYRGELIATTYIERRAA